MIRSDKRELNFSIMVANRIQKIAFSNKALNSVNSLWEEFRDKYVS